MSDQPDMFSTYISMLALARMEATSEGFVRMEVEPGEYIPVTAKDRKLVVLPYEARLKDPKANEYEVFHLLRESGPKDSDLMSRYRHWLINRFNLVIGTLGFVILDFIANKEITKRLSPDQKDFLELVVDADQGSLERWEDIGETVKHWNDIAEAASKPNQIQQVFVSMYIRQAAVLRGQSYQRVAAVTFPFYDELKKLDEDAEAYKAAPKAKKPPKPEDKVFGCEVKVKDRKPFLGLMRYLVPNLDVPNHYDVGSNSRIAPSLDAMMTAWLALGRHLNAITERLTGVSPQHDRLLKDALLNLDWAPAFDNLDALWPQIRMIPPQATSVINEPAPEAIDPRQRAQANHQPAPAPAPAAPPPAPWDAPKPAIYQQPYNPATQYMPPPPAQPGAGAPAGSMSVSDMNRLLGGGRYPQQQQQPYYPGQQAVYPGYGQPVYQQPQQQQYMPPMQPPRRY
jgi:hypothetical protein